MINAVPQNREDPGDAVMAALGSDVRRAIIALLADRPLTVGEIAAHFPISRPAVSKHLRLLSAAGLIVHATAGTRNIYRLEQTGFAAGRDWLDQFWPDALTRFRILAENTYKADKDA